MQFKFNRLIPLYKDMRKNNVSIEQFYITYANVKFDIIIDIDSTPFQMMIGVIDKNFAFVLDIKNGFITEIPDNIYYELCKVLCLNYSKDHFSSFAFLSLINRRIPSYSSKEIVNPDHLLPFRKYTSNNIEDTLKTRFIGWNDHIKDKRIAHNFAKTELYFGKTVANYCRTHNISSLWSLPNDNSKRDISFPPGMHASN